MKKTQAMNSSMNFNRALMGTTDAHRADVLPIKAAPAGASVSPKPDPKVCSEPKPRRRFTAAYKLRILQQADSCTEPGQIGALLRKEGIYSSNQGDFVPASLIMYFNQLNENLDKSPEMVYRETQN